MILKDKLVPGTVLRHAHLGDVVYTKVCHQLEKTEGKEDTLYVEHDGQTKEVTLALVSFRPPKL